MKVRLHVDQPLAAGQAVALTAGQVNYLFNVMRLGVGDPVLVFNGRDGEWRAEVTGTGRRGGLTCAAQTAPLRLPPDLWLVFAPIKKARTDFIVEKATEMGAARILPVQTRFTNAERIRQDRLQAHAVEAAEQCGGTFVPAVDDLQPLDQVLAAWPADRRIMWCDEHLAGASAGPDTSRLATSALAASGLDTSGLATTGLTSSGLATTGLAGQPRGPWAILIGPEGGFSEGEQARLRAMAQAVPVSLGPRILRADTAAVAALTLWQLALGDWG